jgi:hypothetical protein
VRVDPSARQLSDYRRTFGSARVRPTCQHFCLCRLRTLWPCPTISQHAPGQSRNPTSPFSLSTIHLDNPSLTSSVVQHHENGKNKKYLGRHSANRPADAVTAAILHHRYCLVSWPFEFRPLFFGPAYAIQLPSSLPPCPLQSGLTPCSYPCQQCCFPRLQVPSEPRSTSES